MVKGFDMHSLESDMVWSETSNKQAGRPTVDDGRLGGDRDALVWLLSVAWGDIGWQLERASTPQQLREALEPLRGHASGHLLARFLRPTSISATGKEIREGRKILGKAIENLHEARARHDRCSEACHQADMAMSQARPEQLEAVKAELKKRQSGLETA